MRGCCGQAATSLSQRNLHNAHTGSRGSFPADPFVVCHKCAKNFAAHSCAESGYLFFNSIDAPAADWKLAFQFVPTQRSIEPPMETIGSGNLHVAATLTAFNGGKEDRSNDVLAPNDAIATCSITRLDAQRPLSSWQSDFK